MKFSYHSKDNYSLSFFDAKKRLILINKELDDEKINAFVSYDKNSNKMFFDLNKNKYVSMIKYREINELKEFEYIEKDDHFTISYTNEIKNNTEIVGFLRVCFNLTKTSFKKLETDINNISILKFKDKFIFSENLNLANYNKLQKSKDFMIKINPLNINNLSLITIIDKRDNNAQIRDIVNTIIFIWIGILILTLLFSIVFIDKYIYHHIKNLQEVIKEIKQKHLKDNHEITNTNKDEIASITKEFKELSKELQENLSLLENYKHIMDESSIVSKADLAGNITYVNDTFLKVTGYNKYETLNAKHSIVKHEDTPSYIIKDLWNTITKKKIWKGILKNKKKDGSSYWVDIIIKPILNANNEIIEYIAVRHDITQIIQQKEELNKIANTDKLTKLDSRHKLLLDVEKIKKPALCFLNVDNFRQINDFYGHILGDKLLIEIANLLKNYTKYEPLLNLYRTQADEFAIMANLNDFFENEAFYGSISRIINTINSKNFAIENEEFFINITGAISYEKKSTILSSANMALKHAKKEHLHLTTYKDSYSLDKQYENNIKWTKKVSTAIKNDKIKPFFQSIVNNKTGDIEKYESLVRLIDEDTNIISPFFFLDIAKKSKQYTQLTKIMIKKSFETFKDEEVEFSINLTIDDILNEDINYYIFHMLETYKIGKKVVFEIVESESIENFDNVIKFIEEVKKHSCKIAIDDFGTGYSNFEYLMKLKADYIKIDGSMIKNIHNDENAKLVVSTIVDFAKKMHMKTIAEFVENEEILKVVKDLDIDYSQGYHFSAPAESIH